LLVVVAWGTNLWTKQLATSFGGSLTLLGMALAYLNYRNQEKQGKIPVPIAEHRVIPQPGSVLAVLLEQGKHNEAIIQAAINSADRDKPVTFLYLTRRKPRARPPRMMEIVDPYLEDPQAKELFGKAEKQAIRAKSPARRYVYLQAEPSLVPQIWHYVRPHDIVFAADDEGHTQDINPDRIRYEKTPQGNVVHLLRHWAA
jgi:hypothetical protein